MFGFVLKHQIVKYLRKVWFKWGSSDESLSFITSRVYHRTVTRCQTVMRKIKVKKVTYTGITIM